jgi:beta-lactamase regulating signal transducer with metallopeptidase domain/uncharacterized membrane protein YkoI
MRSISQLLLNFLLNAIWQVTLITLTAALCARLLRGTAARYRHLLWVIALASSFGLPLLTSASLFEGRTFKPETALITTQRVDPGSFSATELTPAVTQANWLASLRQAGQLVPISTTVTALIVVIFLLMLVYRSVKLFIAWRMARAIAASAYPVELPASVQTVVSECQEALGISRVRILCSSAVAVPITFGIRAPLVILPEQLLQEEERSVLTSAIGHELVHVLRRDYTLNLLYELIALPLAFHPAATLMRRRIRETRELGCDELVTDRLLAPEVYARSLVQLAGAAITVGRPAETITVGIADADILEERVMTILNRSKVSLWRKNLSLAAAALVFIVPCVAAAPFALRIGITETNPSAAAVTPQEVPLNLRVVRQDDQEKAKKLVDEAQRALKEYEAQRAFEEKLKRKAAELKAFQEQRGARLTPDEETKLKEEWRQLEHQMSELKHSDHERRGLVEFEGAELAKIAQIPMYQAIQIAISQQLGTVLECRLRGHRVDNQENVYYDIRILSTEGGESKISRFAISAIDGRILKTDKR